MIDPHMTEYRAALRGVSPTARPCADSVDLSFWFMCVSVSLRAQRTARTEDDAARRGRLLPNVRR